MVECGSVGEMTSSISTYAYVLNNPLSLVDPFGMSPKGAKETAGDTETRVNYSNDKANEREKAKVEKKAAEQKKVNENSPKNKIPEVWIANVANISVEKLSLILANATAIFVKNGILGLKFNFVDVKEAKKHYGTYKYQMFIAIRNDNNPSASGLSKIGPGEVGVYDERIGWLSYINLAHSSYTSHKNPIYAQGYGLAHEILHQLLGLASYARREGTNVFDHEDSIENLNMDGMKVQIPLGLSPPGTIHLAETILQYQYDYLFKTYETNER